MKTKNILKLKVKNNKSKTMDKVIIPNVYLTACKAKAFKGWTGFVYSFLMEGEQFNLYGQEDISAYLGKSGDPVRGDLSVKLFPNKQALKAKFEGFGLV